MSGPDVSILLCTAGRPADLARTLAATIPLPVPDDWAVELVVIDNSADASARGVVAAAGRGRIDLRYVHEPRRGQCRARNRGLAESAGRAVIFTDDDVRPQPGWVAGMAGPILGGTADAVAGHVRLAPHLRRPWMDAHHLGRLAVTDWTPGAPVDRLVGANMAFRRSVLGRVPGFDVEIGPGALGFHDDTLFAWQLGLAGFRLVAAPQQAWVEHHPTADRLTRGAMLDSAGKTGRSYAYLQHHWHHDVVPTPRRRVVTSLARLLAHRLARPRLWLGRRSAEGCGTGEMHLVQVLAMARQYRLECRRPRRYEFHGFSPRSATPMSAPVASAGGAVLA